ncbi:MAG: xanthine/uracil/vitamin C permease [Boseongicola sp. SB0664_bin_43]|uniref:Xanthine/uracil/vitamin C permease n=1 Tax=Boseongicola sp. SB0664_bin_43 TaxID=2604844 RepID=A0A6B0Y0T5_9RHOB|nr:xanthine/uracil/vitamin C permease [Boseongicola sp. SB0664_bin_43]
MTAPPTRTSMRWVPGGDGMNIDEDGKHIRYEADEKPPTPLAFGLGLQLALLTIAGIVLTPSIVVRAAGGDDPYLSWAAFAVVAVSGISTIVQAVRVGRFGAGYVLLMGTSGAFIAVSIAAIAAGGPALLATLVVISSLIQFVLATQLVWVRRIFTPTVAGTVIMLIAVTVMPIVFGMLDQVPDDAHQLASPLSAAATIAVIGGIALAATGVWRLWAPVIGVIVGSVVAWMFGIYEAERVAQAAWIGLPQGGWPGFDVDFGPAFWSLLPGFVIVTLVGAIETIGDSMAIQHVSWRERRAVDYRAVEGAVAADGLGNMLSGLLGTIPNTTYSTSISVTELTGVASRRVGVAVGLIFLVMAILPKSLAAILAIPGPVVAAYAALLLSTLFVVGMRMVVQDGLDYRKGVVVGVSFWIGVGFQNGAIYPEFFAEFAGGLFQNGMTAGGASAILLTVFLNAAKPRRRRMEVPFDDTALGPISAFLRQFALSSGWDAAMAQRLDAVGEETFLTLHENQDDSQPRPG